MVEDENKRKVLTSQDNSSKLDQLKQFDSVSEDLAKVAPDNLVSNEVREYDREWQHKQPVCKEKVTTINYSNILTF